MSDRPRLHPVLRPLHVGALALGCVIGFGCFVLPGEFLQTAGPVGACLGVLVGGLAMLVIARSYGLMVRALPVSGAEFAYAHYAGGRRHAYVCGWLLALGYLSIVPLNATALGVLATFVAPDLFAWGSLYTVAGREVFAGEVLLASLAIAVVGGFHARGVRAVGRLQVLLTALLVGGVLVVGLGTPWSGMASTANWQPWFAPDRSPLGAVLAIVAISPWLFVGFDTLPQAAEELDFSPGQCLGLMSGAIAAGAVMYGVMILATASVSSWETLVTSGVAWPTGTSVSASLGRLGLTVLTVSVATAVATGINGFYLATSRLLFSMGRAQLLPSWFARVDPVRRTPTHAVLFVGGVSLIAPWFGREVIVWVVDMSAVGTAVGYAYTCVAAWAMTRRGARPDLRFGLTVGDRRFAVAGIALSLGFVLLLVVPGMPAFMGAPSWFALGVWVALGGAFYVGRRRDYASMSSSRLDELILGRGGARRG